MSELVTRFLLGGLIVTAFSVMGEVLRPKRFAGLFGAAPSVALATIPLTLRAHGHSYAALEARSMVAGAICFFVYALCVSRVLIRFKPSTLLTTTLLIPVWIGGSAAFYFTWLRIAP